MSNSKTPASKQSLESLIMNTSNVIRDMYACVISEIRSLEAMEYQKANAISILIRQLSIAVNYSLMDIGVSLRASIASENAYEKRFHLKNLKASISESFKLIVNFGKARNKSIWLKLGNELNGSDEEIVNLYKKITTNLIAFGDSHIDQNLRNLTLHYDEDMMRVYEVTLNINDEDQEMKVLCNYMDILQSIRCLLNEVESLIVLRREDIEINFRIGLNAIVEELINKGGRLLEIVDKVIEDAGGNIDSLANMNKSFQRVRTFVEQQAPISTPVQELDNVQILLNAQMLLLFMLADLAAITKSYLNSKSEEEHKMNLRRFVVIQTSTLVHLYGYNEDEYERSIWKLLMTFLPQSDTTLLEECKTTETLLKKLVADSDDKKERALYVHLVDNSNSKFGVPDTIKAVDAIDPIREISEVNLLIVIMNKVRNWLKHVMDVLSKEAHESRMKSEHQEEEQFEQMLKQCSDSKLPEEQKKQLTDMITSFRDKMMSIIKDDRYFIL